jgi:hypothetical protein
MSVCKYIYIHVCVCCMCTRVYIYLHTNTHIYVCVCVCVCIEQNIAHFCIVAAYHHIYQEPKDNIDICDFLGNVIFLNITSYRHILKKVINCYKRVWFSLLSLTESLIVRRVERDIIINEQMSSCKATVIIVRFSLTLKFLNRFLTNLHEIIFEKSVQSETNCSMLTKGPTGKQTGWNKWSLFANLRRRLKVNTKSNTSPKRHYYYFTIFYVVLLFEVFYLFNACDIAKFVICRIGEIIQM